MRKASVVLVVLTLSAAGLVLATRAVRQKEQRRQIDALQNEAAALIKEGRLTQAADKLEQLQVRFMNAEMYREALDASLKIEQVSQRASDRKSPWNYVRIAEAYLGMGEKDRYLDWMERAVYERSFSKLDYFQDARLNALKDHPRYKTLVNACAKVIGVGQPAKEFQVTLLDGSSFSLHAQKGKVVLIDFWDVACGPCRREMPNLKEIFKDFKDRGLEIVGISMDTDKTLLYRYVNEAALPWKIACSFDGWSDSTAKLYKISATPSTWLIDRQGVVRYYDVRGAELRRAVEALIRES